MLFILQKLLLVIKVQFTYGSSGTSKGETQQHEQGDKFLSALHVGHAERAVMAAKTHLRRLQHISQLQEVQRDHRGSHNRQLRVTWAKAMTMELLIHHQARNYDVVLKSMLCLSVSLFLDTQIPNAQHGAVDLTEKPNCVPSFWNPSWK